MPFPPEVLSAARAVQRDLRSAQVGFVPVQETVAIGYVTDPGPHGTDVAFATPIDPQHDGQSCSIRLEQQPDAPEIHWVLVNQSLGAMLYTWQSGGHTHHFLALASDDPRHKRDMDGAEAANERRKLALRLHRETGMKFSMLLRLARTVNSYHLATLAIGLAIWLLEQAEDNLGVAQDRADRLTLMKNPDRLAELRGHEAVSRYRTGDTIGHLCMGAKIILDSAKKAGEQAA